MDKILSIQTIKNVFAALGAKTSDSNYGVALLDKTTAEPKGLMGMSDLASVLGVSRIRWYGSDETSNNPDNLRTKGVNEICAGSFNSIPNLASVWMTVFSLTAYATSMYCIQIAFKATQSQDNVYVRVYNPQAGWTEWKPITGGFDS